MKKIFIMLIGSLFLTGCSNKNPENLKSPSLNGEAVINGNYQEVIIDINSFGYENITVQKDIPVKFILNVTDENLNGCNNGIIIQEWDIKKSLKIGENIIEFTPTQEGVFTYTCWMTMLENKITVVDTIENLNDIQGIPEYNKGDIRNSPKTIDNCGSSKDSSVSSCQ